MRKYTATNKKEFLDAFYDILDNSLSGVIFCDTKRPFSMAYLVIPNEEDNEVREIYCSSNYSPDITYSRPLVPVGFYCKGKFVDAKKGIFPIEFFDESKEIRELLGKNPPINLIKRKLHEVAKTYVANKYPSLESLEEAGLFNVVSSVKNMDWDILAIQADLISQDGERHALQRKHYLDVIRSMGCWWSEYNFPIPVLVKVSAGITPLETLIQLVLDEYKDCMNDNNVYWEIARRYMYEVLVPKARAALTEEQKILAMVVRELENHCWTDTSYITIRIKGRDALLSEYTREVFPDFSIEGKEVVIQRLLGDFRCSPLKLRDYDGAKFQPKLRNERSCHPLVKYIEKYSFEDVLSISYRGKKYYQKPRQKATV